MEDFVSKRLNELRLIEEQSCLELENLQNKQNLMNDFIIIKQLESEKKVLVRKLNDAKIRIRNLERNNMNRSRTRTLDTSLISTISEMKTCDSIVNDEPACDKEIDFEDEYFDPELLDLERVRPTPRLCPHYPLPHSMVPVSSRYIKRVGLWRDSNVNGLNSTLIDSIGQFTSVEDQLDNSEVGDLTSSSPFSSSVTTSLDSSFPTPTNNANSMTPTHTSNVIQRGSRRPSGKTTGPGLPHSVDSGIESPRSTPLYSPTTPITPKTSSSPSVSMSENSPEK